MRAPSLYRPDIGQTPTCFAPAPTCASTATATAPNACQQQAPAASAAAVASATNKMPPRATGGQRTALKLTTAAPPPPGSGQQAKSATTVGAGPNQRWSQAPDGYGSPLGRCGPECDEDLDDISDCSCSNSLICQQQQHHISQAPPVRIAEHELRYGGSPQHHHHHQMHNHPMHHHQIHPSHQYPPHSHQHNSNSNSNSNNHRHNHHHHHHHNHLNHDSTSDDCAFINQHPFHRPPMRPASTGSPSPPPPPPLVRQSTYTAAPDTITDSSIIGPHHRQQSIPLTPPPPISGGERNGCGATSDFMIPANERVNGHQGNYGTLRGASAKNNNNTMKYQTCGPNNSTSKQRQSVSFRRSATLGGPGETNHSGNNIDCEHALKLDSNVYAAEIRLLGDETGEGKQAQKQEIYSKHGKKQHSKHSGGRSNQLPGVHSGSGRVDSASDGVQFTRHNIQTAAYPNASPAGVGAPGSNQPPPVGHAGVPLMAHTTSPNPAATYQPSSPTRGNGAGNGSTRGINRYLYPGSLWSFDSPLPPPTTSHRTNSSWMRISSIILAPIGLVIILFIVVSPLLHYLM